MSVSSLRGEQEEMKDEEEWEGVSLITRDNFSTTVVCRVVHSRWGALCDSVQHLQCRVPVQQGFKAGKINYI
jgi:hypothetical protein